jgi:hypothetical protein
VKKGKDGENEMDDLVRYKTVQQDEGEDSDGKVRQIR